MCIRDSHNRIAADGEGVIVAYNYQENCKAQLPAAVRDLIAALEQRQPGKE